MKNHDLLKGFRRSRTSVAQGTPTPQRKDSEHMLFAQDWGATNEFTRVNAYTFRGEESRPPKVVEEAGGFHPPITRTDQWYVDNKVFPHFQDYMKRRFQMNLTREQFNRVYNPANLPQTTGRRSTPTSPGATSSRGSPTTSAGWS